MSRCILRKGLKLSSGPGAKSVTLRLCPIPEEATMKWLFLSLLRQKNFNLEWLDIFIKNKVKNEPYSNAHPIFSFLSF